MKKIILIFIILLIRSICSGEIIHTEADDFLVQQVSLFTVKNATMYETILQLCKEQKVRINLENFRNFSKKTGKAIPPKRFSVTYLESNISSILTDLCKQDPTYFWEYSRNGLLNILPRSNTMGTYDNSTLEWGIGGFKAEKETVEFVCSTTFPFGWSLNKSGIPIQWTTSTHTTNFKDFFVHINLPPATGRDGLNSIVKSASRNYIWHLFWKDHKPIIEFKQVF